MRGFLRTAILALLAVIPLGAAVQESSYRLNPFIMGWGSLSAGQLAGFLLSVHRDFPPGDALELAQFYLEESGREGVNHDLAFAQMLLETSFQRYGGQVSPIQNNFAGLGAVDGGAAGLAFPDRRTGVRAHIQHLKAYGSRQALNQDLVNPRFGFVVRESAPTVYDLARRWASDPDYGFKIMALVEKLYKHAAGVKAGETPLEVDTLE